MVHDPIKQVLVPIFQGTLRLQVVVGGSQVMFSFRTACSKSAVLACSNTGGTPTLGKTGRRFGFRYAAVHVLEIPHPRDPSTFSEGTWALQAYITVSPITF